MWVAATQQKAGTGLSRSMPVLVGAKACDFCNLVVTRRDCLVVSHQTNRCLAHPMTLACSLRAIARHVTACSMLMFNWPVCSCYLAYCTVTQNQGLWPCHWLAVLQLCLAVHNNVSRPQAATEAWVLQRNGKRDSHDHDVTMLLTFLPYQ